MKMKNLLALLLALIFTFISVLPAFAEGEELPDQEAETVQQPEGEPVVSDPESALDPSEEPSVVLPENPDEGEDPLVSQDLPDPGTEETPNTEDEEDPNAPPDPGDGETEGEEPSESPADEENPDEEIPGEENQEDSEPEEDGEKSESSSEDEEPVIDVLVPSSGQIVVNPYHMKIDTSYGETTEQIVHEPQTLTSLTDFPLLVSVRATGIAQPGSGTRFVSAPPADDALDKEIFLYVEFQPDPTLWSGIYTNAFNQILVTDWGDEKLNVMMLDTLGVGYFHISGAATPFPETKWSSEDMVDVILTFAFSPAEVQPEPVHLPEEDYPAEENSPAEDDFPVAADSPAEGDFLAAEVFPTGEDFPAEPVISEDLEVQYDW